MTGIYEPMTGHMTFLEMFGFDFPIEDLSCRLHSVYHQYDRNGFIVTYEDEDYDHLSTFR